MHTDHRDHIRAELLRRAERDPRVAAAAVTGSTAAHTDDEWSDLDLFFGVQDADPLDVLDDFTAVLRDELGALHHFDLRAGPAIYRAYLLEGGSEVDLGLVPIGEFRSSGDAPFEVVFGTAQPASPATGIDVDHVIGLVWHHVRHARSGIERGQAWSAEHWISALRGQVLTLAAARHGMPTAYAKGADRLPAALTRPLEESLVGRLDPELLRTALRAATLAALDEIGEHAPAAADRLRESLLDAVGTGRRGGGQVGDGSTGERGAVVELAESVRRRLRDERVVWCATVRSDGPPHVTPVWFVFDAGTWWVATAQRNVKVANVQRRGQVSLALPDPDHPLVAEGRARIVWSDFPPAVVSAFREKYDGWDITSTEPDGPRVLLEIVTDRWLFTG